MQPLRSVIALLSVALSMTACTKATPPWASDGGPSAPGSVSSQQPAVPQVARPWRPGITELGVNVLWEDSKDDDDEVTRAKARRMLDHLISLNVNAVAVNFLFVMDGPDGNAVRADPKNTPSPERVAIFLDEAAKSKMRVSLRPLLDERSVRPVWRGKISPGSRAKWFASYTRFLASYAKVAQQHNAAEMVVGVELNSLQTDPRWKTLVSTLRDTFTGELTYSVNFDVFEEGLPTPAVDRVGVDAYFRVKAPDNAPVERLTSAWEGWLDRHAGERAKGLVLHEVGIAAQNGAYLHPASWGNASTPLNMTVQKNWYTAVCRSVESRNLAGLYFWNIRMHQNPGSEDPNQADRLTFVDRPAESVLRDCYGRLGT